MGNESLQDKLKRAYSQPEETAEEPKPRIPHRPHGMGRILRGRSFDQLSTTEKLGIIYSEKGEEWGAADIASRLAGKKR